MKYFIIAGEVSGDLHGANLIKSMLKKDNKAVFRYYGGDRMKEVCPEGIAMHINELAVMGIFEVISRLPFFIKHFSLCINEIIDFQPDAIILIDYGGFNLRIASLIKRKLNVPIYYFIPPKVWAWGLNRVHKLQKYVDKVFSILPFEVEFFKSYDVNVQYYGNPLVKEINNFLSNYNESRESFLRKNNLYDKPIIALLPGSRKQEIKLCLNQMLSVANKFQNFQFVIAGISLLKNFYNYNDIDDFKNVKIIYDQTYPLLYHSHAAIVTSGTATLETALFKVPQVVVYKTSSLSYNIGQVLIALGYINVKNFSLPNLIARKEIVKELLQNNVDKFLLSEFKKIVEEKDKRNEMLNEYEKIIETLGDNDVYELVANDIVNLTIK